MACLIGIDIGTTSTIGILIRVPGEVLALASRPVTLRSPHPGWAEQDPGEWWANTGAVVRELLARAGVNPAELAGIGVAGMLPAVVVLGADGAPLRPSIQQSDGRCGREVEELRAEVAEDAFVARTGNGLNQQLATGKLRWLERHEPAVFGRTTTVLGSYNYINWRLTGERTVDEGWALEAGFVDLRARRLAPDLIALAHLPAAAVPRLVRPHEVVGRVTAAAAAATGLPAGLPVVGGAADFIASALAAGLTRPGDVLLKFGGSVDLLTVATAIVPDRRLYLDYHLIPGLYLPNGCMATGGSALNWLAAEWLGGTPLAALDREAAAIPAGADGVTILPYFLGEKTPVHDPAARGIISGLSLSHTRGHLWRALLEAYAFALAHHLEVLHDVGHPTERFTVSDGGAASTTWMQIVANVLQRPLRRLQGHPGSCLGAAWTAAVGLGAAPAWEGVAAWVGERDVIQPDPATAGTYREAYRRYRGLYLPPPTPAARP